MDRIRFLICLSIDFPLEKHYDERTKFRINILLHRVRFLISRHVSKSYILLYRFLFHWIAYHHCKLKKKKTLLTKKEWRNAATIYIYIYNRIEFNLRFNISIPSRSFLDPFSISRKRTRLRFRGWMGRRRRIPVPRICSGFCARENGIPTVFRRWSGSVMGVWVKVVSGLIEG